MAQARYRMDDEDGAVRTWETILELPETTSTYAAWRNVAAARVRDGDLNGAIAAYREADRRAPPQDKAEIANRLGWLAKETGNVRASRRYFARGRGSHLADRDVRDPRDHDRGLARGGARRERRRHLPAAVARQAPDRRRPDLAPPDGRRSSTATRIAGRRSG